jgi:hypothetical protein
VALFRDAILLPFAGQLDVFVRRIRLQRLHPPEQTSTILARLHVILHGVVEAFLVDQLHIQFFQ